MAGHQRIESQSSTSNFTLTAFVLPALAVSFILFVLWFYTRAGSVDERASDAPPSVSTSSRDAPARGDDRSPPIAPMQAQSTCPPINRQGATCEITPACSGWIRQAPDLPAGLTHGFAPALSTESYSSIRYLDESGQPHEWRTGATPSRVMAWDLCPRTTITLSYGIMAGAQ